MFNNKYIILNIILFSAISFGSLNAQEIKGDTIYASVNQQTNLVFPETVTFCDYNDKTAINRFYKRVEYSKVSLKAQQKNAAPAIIWITEGTRVHELTI